MKARAKASKGVRTGHGRHHSQMVGCASFILPAMDVALVFYPALSYETRPR